MNAEIIATVVKRIKGVIGGRSVTVAMDDNEDNAVLYPCPSVCQ